MIFKDTKEYARGCDMCERVGGSSNRDELPLQSVRALQIFEKWVIDFIWPINSSVRHSHARYIIAAIEYLTRWVEETPVKDCTIDTATRFISENIISRFECPRSLTNDQGSHFINETIAYLLQNFMIQHHKSSQYHP